MKDKRELKIDLGLLTPVPADSSSVSRSTIM